MKPEQYIDLFNRLREFDDIQKLHRETGIDEELLLVVYTQRFSRDITRNFYKVKAYTRKMVQDWDRKQSFMQIAKKWYFSPILTAYFIMTEKGCKRKEFWGYVREPSTAPDRRLQKEFAEIADNDMVYSPKGMDIQYARGRWGEAKLGEWLKWKEFEHQTEKDLKGKTAKTPDCLLDKPFELGDAKISWIESKAIFGDEVEFRKNVRKQLKQYTEMFGNGIVVYWFGFCDNIVPPDGVFVMDGRFFEVPGTDCTRKLGDGSIIRPAALVGPGNRITRPHTRHSEPRPPMKEQRQPQRLQPQPLQPGRSERQQDQPVQRSQQQQHPQQQKQYSQQNQLRQQQHPQQQSFSRREQGVRQPGSSSRQDGPGNRSPQPQGAPPPHGGRGRRRRHRRREEGRSGDGRQGQGSRRRDEEPRPLQW